MIKALIAVFNKKSHVGLFGNSFSVKDNKWTNSMAGIGAGSDSFYEYLFKSHVLFGDQEYLDMFVDSYRGIMTHLRDANGYIYSNINYETKAIVTNWIDSLAAFFPGLQCLFGDVKEAIPVQFLYHNIWKRFTGLPERFDYKQKTAAIGVYPLRPELIESTYMLYQATKNPFYLETGEMMLNDIESVARLKCGYATIDDVTTGRLSDRMESFFISETLKYLYLLFDSNNFINKMSNNLVFSTEGHMFYLNANQTNVHVPSTSRHTCPNIRQSAALVQAALPDLSKDRILECENIVGIEKVAIEPVWHDITYDTSLFSSPLLQASACVSFLYGVLGSVV